LNLTENLWAILKRCAEELGRQTKEELIEVIIAVWESVEMSLVNKHVDSIASRLNEVVLN
jgi:hypothetical protein